MKKWLLVLLLAPGMTFGHGMTGSSALAEQRLSGISTTACLQDSMPTYAVHDRGRQWLVMANQGLLSNPMGHASTEPFDPLSTRAYPELEFPGGSGTLFLFSGGIWIGAKVDGVPIVSCATDGDNGTNEFCPVVSWASPHGVRHWYSASRDSSAKCIDDDGDWATDPGNDVNGDGNPSSDFDGVPGKDDDGDGLVDEETLNGRDDDADGLIDEDVGSVDPVYASSGQPFLNDDPSRISPGDANGDRDLSYDPEPCIDEDPPGDSGSDFVDNDHDGLIDDADSDFDGDLLPGSNDDDGDTIADEDQSAEGTQEWTTAYADTSEAWLYAPDVDGFTPLGVRVVQHSRQWGRVADGDFLLIDYIVTNIGGYVLEELWLGLFFDFDVGHVTMPGDARCLDDTTFYVDSLWMAVGGDPDGDDGLLAARWFGVLPVRTPGDWSTTTYRNFDRMAGGEPVPQQLKYQLLSSGTIDSPAPWLGDWRLLVAFGSQDTLLPAESVRVRVAIVSGADLDELARSACSAMQMVGMLAVQSGTEPFPDVLRLVWVHPNPLRDHTTVSMTMASCAQVRADVYDLRGRLVGTLVRGSLPAGNHLLVWNAGDAPPGLYVCRVKAGGETASARMVVIR